MKNSTKVQAHVGSFQDMAIRFTNSWNQASKGVEVKETNVKSLAVSLGRDYKNVHHDVSVVLSAGLLL
jgi:predicted transcriptional regulator